MLTNIYITPRVISNNSFLVDVYVTADHWKVTDVEIDLDRGHTLLYTATDHVITASLRVHNLQAVSYPGGMAAYKLRLFLHTSDILGQGDHIK